MYRETSQARGPGAPVALVALLTLGTPATSEVATMTAQPMADQAALGYPQLLAKTEAEGSVKVIVGLAIAPEFQPEGFHSTPQAIQSQREAIALAQQSLLDSLSLFGVSVKANFRFVPFIAMTVDESALEFLVASKAAGVVTSIEEDIFVPATLASTIPIVGADDAWARGFEAQGQAVAILDSGIEKNHTFFGGAASRVVSEACYSSKDLANGIVPLCPNGQTSQVGSGSANANTTQCYSGPGTSGTHLCTHGTHVAGIAAGEGITFSGVARSASIIAIQVFTRLNSAALCSPEPAPCIRTAVSDYNLGLQRVYALRNGHDIAAANMSLGGGAYTAPCDSSQASTKASIDTLRSAEIATVVASGNSGYLNALSAPACISTAVSVAASTDADWVASFSNRASFLDLLAPGDNVTSSIPGGLFATWDGTSMAAPHVTGAWAVLKQAKPGATVDQVRSALTNTGVPIYDFWSGLTKPRIQIDAALDTFVRMLSITKLGTGTGSVTSTPAGIDCGSICEKEFTESSTVQLNTSPAGDSEFSGWTGHSDCSNGFVTMNVDKTCNAHFDLKPMLTVTKGGDGSGTVTSNPAGVSCGADCSERYDSGTVVRLTPTASTGSSFVGWSGHVDCGDGKVTMNGDRACEATFMLHRNLSVTTSGGGSGTVISSPGGINCGLDCSEAYPYGIAVSLMAVPDMGSEFGVWSGHTDCADGSLTMDADKTCDAAFEPCSIASEVTVSNVTISVPGVTHQACNKLIVGPDVVITSTGQVEFRAGNEVEFVSPLTVHGDGEMTVVIGPPLP